MNPIIRHLILQKVRAYVKARKEGKMGKYSFSKGLQKLIQGGGITFVATLLALWFGKGEAESQAVVNNLANNLIVSIPVISGLLAAIVNAVKFFAKKKINS